MESMYWLILVIPVMLFSISGIILSEGHNRYMWSVCLLVWAYNLIAIVK